MPQTIVYKYGCPHWADLDDAAMRQLKLANGLWNKLVEIERAHEEALARIWGTHPEVAAAQAAVDEATAVIEVVAGEMRVTRQRDRSTMPRTTDKARLADARKARKDAREALKAAKDAAKEATKALRDEAAAGRRSALKAACQEFAANGLYWGTYKDICRRRFPVAVKRVLEQRKAGRPAELRFHRFDGTGTITTQVMWQSGDPLPIPAALASEASKWRNVFQMMPASGPSADGTAERMPGGNRLRGTDRHWTLRLRVASGHHITIPVVVDRPLPPDAEVKEVKVSRRRTGMQYRLTVAVAFRIPAPPAKADGDVLDIDFGWASGGSGTGLRVARVGTASGTLPPPPGEVAPLVTEGDWYEIWCPAQWRDLAGRPDAIRADRDDLFNVARDKAAGALDDPAVAVTVERRNRESWRAAGRDGDPPVITAAAVMRWRAPRKLAMLIRLWPQDHPLATVLEEWRQRDRHLHEFEAHERDQILARRKDAYRKLAAWLAESARLIVIRDLDIAAARRVPDVGREDAYDARHGRRNAHFAAPAELKVAIENAARMRGVRVIYRSEEPDSE